MAVLALFSWGCSSCGDKTKPPVDHEPAGRRDLALVDDALKGGGSYSAALAELEKSPASALRAVREQSAPPHSRKAVFLAMMADHLEHVDEYHRWQRTLDDSPKLVDNKSRDLRDKLGGGSGSGPPVTGILGPVYPKRIPGLDGAAQVQFWAERLLVLGGDTAHLAAVPHLERIGTAAAIDALALYVRTPASSIALLDATHALGRLGRGRDLADALAAYQHPAVPPTTIPGAVATLKTGFAQLPPQGRADSEAEILGALETELMSADQRAGYVAALGAFGSSSAVERLVALRRTEWGQHLKTEIDAASAAILDREDDTTQKGSAKP